MAPWSRPDIRGAAPEPSGRRQSPGGTKPDFFRGAFSRGGENNVKAADMKRLLTAILLLATAGFSGFADPGWVGFQGLSHLDSLELVDSNTGLDGPDTDNFSGCCIMPATQELLVIINSPEAIQVYGLDGSYKRRIDLSGFDDTEGICQYDPANDLFAIVEEDANDITVVTIMASTTSIAKSSGTTHAMGLTFGSPNKGIEGIAYDPVRDCFYACKEKLAG